MNINRIYKWGVFETELLFKCANDMLAIRYIGCIRNGNKVCIKAFDLNFIDAKGF